MNILFKKAALLSAFFLITSMGVSAQRVDESLIPFRSGEKWGFSDANRKMVIAPKYDDAKWFSEGLAPVKVGKRWGYINKAGKLVIPAKFTVANNFRRGFVESKKNPGGDTVIFAGASLRPDLYEVCINTRGAVLKGCPAIPENSVPGNRGPIKRITSTKTYTINNNNGMFDRVVNDFAIMGSPDTYYIVEKGGKYGITNNKFDTIMPVVYNEISLMERPAGRFLQIQKDGMTGIADMKGTIIIAPENTKLDLITGKNGNEYLLLQKDGLFYVKDMQNNDIIRQGYKNIIWDTNGFVIVGNDNLQGYYFTDNETIAPRYKKVEWVRDAKFLKVTDTQGNIGYINAKGEEFYN